MKIKHNAEVPLNDVTMEGAAGCKVRWLVGEADAAPNFAMRQFELEPGGHTPGISIPTSMRSSCSKAKE